MRLLFLLTALCGPLCAATFTVNNLNDSGAGSLREAITAAEATAGADDIVCATTLALPGTITLQTALPDITEDLTITGPASDDLIVRRSAAATPFRIFTITGGTIEISHLWLGDGSVVTNAPNTAEGGCIHNAGSLTLTDCLIFDCAATGGNATTGNAGHAMGGAIYSAGSLTLERVAVVDCVATGGDTADAAATCGMAFGGGVRADASLTMLSCRLSGCSAQAGSNSGLPAQLGQASGGCIEANGSTVILDSDFTGGSTLNATGTFDGASGIYLANAASLDMRRTSIRGGTGNAMTLTAASVLENCTISGNQGQFNGGLVLVAISTVTLRFCTITANDGPTCGGIERYTGTVNVHGSIVAGNTGASPDVEGTFTDQGFNLIGDETGSGSFTTSTLVGDSLNPINPGLNALQSFGATWGHMPQWGSYVIDQGGGAAPIDDQRGANRLLFNPPDIGAIEFIPNQAPSFTAGGTVEIDNDGDQVTVAGWATNMEPGVYWESGQTLEFVITGVLWAFDDPPEIDPVTGDLTFEPTEDNGGTFIFDVVLRDDGGAAGGGTDTSTVATLVITLNDDSDDDISDENWECSTGPGGGHSWLCLLGLAGLLGWRLRRGEKTAT